MMTASTDDKKWWVLTALCVMMTALSLDLTAVNLAVVVISKNLHTNLQTAQWLVNGTLIVAGMLTATSGKLADIYGARIIFLLGAIVFLLASLGAGSAMNSTTIVVSRLAQGIGIALCFPMIYLLLFTHFPIRQRGIAVGILTACNGLSQAIGPTLGGIFIQFLNWRWIFFINIPIVLMSIVIILWAIPAKNIDRKPQALDKVGIVFLSLMLFTLLFALNNAQSWGLTSLALWLWLLASCIFFIAFLWQELHFSQPVLDLRLFRNKVFLLINLIRAFYQIIFLGMLFLLGLFLQNILSFSAVKAGLYLLMMTACFGAIAPLTGKLIDWLGTHIPLFIGLLLLMLSSVFFALLQIPLAHQWILIVGLITLGMASGILLPSTSIAALSSVSPEKTGMASGIFYTVMFVSCGIGVAFVGTLLSAMSSHELTALLMQNHIHFELSQLPALKNIAAGLHPVSSINTIFDAQTLALINTISKQTFIHAFKMIGIVFIGLSFINLVLCFLIPIASHKRDS